MNRRTFCLAATLAAIAPAIALADPREFPPGVRRGKMTPGYFPEIVIDGKVRRLSPAARIFNADNMVELPAAIRGSNILVNYTVNGDGDIDRVWILTAEEAKQKLPAA
ncbi:hypothetical protein IP91_03089 [Pseudoduganella lurida]|uniref:Uncharacterized protein n=1 Tax=Pseudoduganella lurida TaxID=1036180 RepID=A0A562R7C3_9BURK|nr:hypothetical protein [Pseudoduganella lurida]TWI64320.1 hypothetical protein IP91_03089 [Pseudoduganella lurida]